MVAYALARLLIVFAFPSGAYIPINPAPSFPVLAFTFVLAVVTGVVFGIAPAWSASRTDPAAALHGAGRTTGHTTIAQKSLVVLQAALSIILLTTAGLMIATLRNLEDRQFGFGTEDKLVISVRAGFSGYAPEKLAVIYRDLDTRLRHVPAVRSAGLALYAQMSGDNCQSGVTLEERPVPMVSPPWDRVNAGGF